MFKTHMAPIVAQIALGMFLRTSFLLVPLLQTFLQGAIAQIRPFYMHVTAPRWNLYSPGYQRCSRMWMWMSSVGNETQKYMQIFLKIASSGVSNLNSCKMATACGEAES